METIYASRFPFYVYGFQSKIKQMQCKYLPTGRAQRYHQKYRNLNTKQDLSVDGHNTQPYKCSTNFK